MIKRLIKDAFASKKNRVVSSYYNIVNSLSSLTPEPYQNVPEGDNIVVFAPHCDDEALGCGGILYKHVQKNCQVTAVFMTDGSQCETDLSKEEIVKLRKEEAYKAAKILGIHRCVFMDFPDRELVHNSESLAKVESLLKELNPDTIYIPFYLDNHPDHKATASICVEALKRNPVKNVFFYEVWTAMIPNRIVNIDDCINNKMEAIAVYKSQKGIERLGEQIKALNKFRSIGGNEGFEYAEALYKISESELSKWNF